MSNLRLLDPVFGDSFESALRRFFPTTQVESDAAQLRMRIDVREEAGSYKVKADIPGVKKEDISVRVDGNMVQIEAEARGGKESRDEGQKVLRSERYYGTISRTFSLGEDIDADKVQAKYVDGVLDLDLPKKGPAGKSRIAIQ